MLKRRKRSVLVLGVCMVGMGGWAFADGGHGGHRGYSSYSSVGVGIVVDPFLLGSWYYPSPYYYPGRYYYPPYYYPPAVVTVPSTPPVYIERAQDAEPAPPSSASWYYCADPQGYYPYVEKCPGGWQAVAPRPPAAAGEGN
jgi:hypothetical protein